jgi:SAM-dependent methyltransferase
VSINLERDIDVPSNVDRDISTSPPRGIHLLHPELGAGGYISQDGTIEFYGRVRSIINPGMHVLDFGAGRAAWAQDDTCAYRRRVRDLRDTGVVLIGCDTDDAILQNPVLEHKYVTDGCGPLPFADASMDIVIADYVLEHLPDRNWFANEIKRVLKPGGWLCGRTPPRFHYVVIGSSLIPKVLHRRVLGRAQEDRKAEDVFDAHYQLNSVSALNRAFPAQHFANHTYIYTGPPQYHFNRVLIYRVMALAHAVLPRSMTGNLFVFIQKRIA